MSSLPPVAVSAAHAAPLGSLRSQPPDRFHPVPRSGRPVAPLDRDWARPRVAGVAGARAATLAVAAAVAVASPAAPLLGGFMAGIARSAGSSPRVLLEAAAGAVAAAATAVLAGLVAALPVGVGATNQLERVPGLQLGLAAPAPGAARVDPALLAEVIAWTPW